VSVVATGIEAEAVAHAAPGKVFTFPARQPVTVQAAAASEPTTSQEETLNTELSARDDGDELLLGSDDILTSPVGAPPIAPPEDEDETVQPAASGGGTLFERMSNIARGASKAQIGEAEEDHQRDPIDIPRFLNRQNNQ
jgi:cell division protein FtsZ